MWKPQMTSFPMRKRSSDFASWVAWSSILAIAIVVGLVLSVTQIAAMSSKNVRFLNIRVPTVEDFRTKKPSGDDVVFSSRTPMIFVGKKYVTIGSVAGVIAPRPGGDVVLLKKEADWLSRLGSSVAEWKKAKDILPSSIVAIAYEESDMLESRLALVQGILGEMSKANKIFGGSENLPAPIFVGFASQKFATAVPSHRP
jgi:hypothetical protein